MLLFLCILHFVSVLLTLLISAILSNISFIKLSSLLSWYPASSSVEKWRLLRFAEVSPFCVACCFLADCPGKKNWVGKIIFLELDSGDCWIPFFFCVYSCLAGCPGKKWFLGRENHFLELNSGGCWIPFFFCVYSCLACCQGKKWFLGRENHFLELNSGGCWIPFFFCVYSCLAGCRGKKWFLGRENFFGIEQWWLLDSFLFLCLQLLGRLPRKKNDFWVGKIIFLELDSGDCWIPFFFCVYSCLAGCPGKKNWVGKIIFLELNSGDCWIPFFFCVYSCLAGCPRKKWFLGRENHFFWNWTVVIAGFFLFCVYSCLAGCPEKNDFWVGKIIFWHCGEWWLLGFLQGLLRLLCLLRVGIQRPQWGKNTCEDCQKDWLYSPILGGYRFFFFLIVLGGWGNVVAWSFSMLMTPLFSQPQMASL